MTERFGDQTVTFVAVASSGSVGYLGLRGQSRPGTAVPGCRMRPWTTKETPDGPIDTATEMWKITAPPAAAVLSAKPDGEISYDGKTFHIVGPVQPKRDMAGVLHHVTIFCKRQVT